MVSADEFARSMATPALMERGLQATGPRMGVFVKWVVDDVMLRNGTRSSDPAMEVAAANAVADAAARWFTQRKTSRISQRIP